MSKKAAVLGGNEGQDKSLGDFSVRTTIRRSTKYSPISPRYHHILRDDARAVVLQGRLVGRSLEKKK